MNRGVPPKCAVCDKGLTVEHFLVNTVGIRVAMAFQQDSERCWVSLDGWTSSLQFTQFIVIIELLLILFLYILLTNLR